MILDVTDFSHDQIDALINRIEDKPTIVPISNHPYGVEPVRWYLHKGDDNYNTPQGQVIYVGTIDKTFEVKFEIGDRPCTLGFKGTDDKIKKYLLFPPPLAMTVSSKFIKVELYYAGKISGYSLLKD